MNGWIARDTFGVLYFYQFKPKKGELNDVRYLQGYPTMTINIDAFPDVTYENSPVEVVLTIEPTHHMND